MLPNYHKLFWTNSGKHRPASCRYRWGEGQFIDIFVAWVSGDRYTGEVQGRGGCVSSYPLTFETVEEAKFWAYCTARTLDNPIGT